MSDNDFFSFDNALDKLELAEDDLKRLISAGEIRAFRDGSKMRLRTEDVNRVATDLGLGGEVNEQDAGEVLEVEEVMLSDDDNLDAGMVTTQLSEEDTLLDDDLEVVEVAEELQTAPLSGTGRAARGARVVADTATESTGMLLASVGTTAIMLWGMAFVVAMLDGRASGITSAVVDALK
jgi:excisionase family DNA binding protein